jgi:molybdopterin molybdotransferase
MIEESEARSRILAAVERLPAENAPLSEVLGRYAAADAWAAVSVPPHDQSAMDGYAIHASDCGATDKWLSISGEQPAGPQKSLQTAAGQAVRIFTGAVIPAGTAAVVMQEDTALSADKTQVKITEAAVLGEFIRRKGSDLAAGQKMWSAGEKLTAMRLGLAASQGLAEVSVCRLPRVGIVTTGDELRPAGQALRPGEIYNSNQTLLASQLREEFPSLPIVLAHVADDPLATQQALGQLAGAVDALIIAGGVSVGDHDHVKPALQALGAALDFWRVRVKPGKPFLHGHLGNTVIFGLPGNPVSAYVTNFAFVLPALRKLAGKPEPLCHPPGQRVRLSQPLANKDTRPTYFRGVFSPGGQEFSPQGLQESHALATLARANMLARIEPGVAAQAGDWVEGWGIGG